MASGRLPRPELASSKNGREILRKVNIDTTRFRGRPRKRDPVYKIRGFDVTKAAFWDLFYNLNVRTIKE